MHGPPSIFIMNVQHPNHNKTRQTSECKTLLQTAIGSAGHLVESDRLTARESNSHKCFPLESSSDLGEGTT